MRVPPEGGPAVGHSVKRSHNNTGQAMHHKVDQHRDDRHAQPPYYDTEGIELTQRWLPKGAEDLAEYTV